jgi:hypothetical protein
MPNLGARADDRHSGKPELRPGLWFLALICMAALAIAVAGLIGSYVNGDGDPYLSHPSGKSSE